MHYSGTIRHGDIMITGHIMAFFALLCHILPRAGKQRLIFSVLQILSGIGFQNFISGFSLLAQSAQYILKQRLCHVIGVTVRRFHLYICLIRIHTQGHIGRQRPGCGGPGQEISLFPHTFKTRHRRTLLYRLITLGYLMAGKRRTAAWAVGNNLKAFI